MPIDVRVGMLPFEQLLFERSLRKAYEGVKNAEAMVKRGVRVALGSTAKKGRALVAKQITDKVAIKRSDVLRYISVHKARIRSGTIAIVLSKTDRIQLGFFTPRAIGRAATTSLVKRRGRKHGPHIRRTADTRGVSYKINRRNGRGFVPAAYIVPVKRAKFSKTSYDVSFSTQKLVMRRFGKKQVVLRGPSPWGVYVKTKTMQRDIRKELRAILRTELWERVRVAKLQSQGTIAMRRGAA